MGWMTPHGFLKTVPGSFFRFVAARTEDGWFAARPSGTEDVYKLYAESFRDRANLAQIQEEAHALVGATFAAARV